MRYCALIICIFFILTAVSDAGIFFSYPRDGRFKMLSVKNDPWFNIDKENWTFENPDKWQHYMGNYTAATLLKRKLGKFSTAAILTSANVVKEIEDGFREGASVRDLVAGTIGMLAGIYRTNLICDYDSESIVLKYYVLF